MTTQLRTLVRGAAYALAAILFYSAYVRAETTGQAANIPAFPDYPPPQETLSEQDRGTLYFSSRSPTDFRWILAEDTLRYPLIVRGDLYLPDGASADAPVPAMIILHGSGSIRESREVAYARLLAEKGVAAFVVHSFAARGLTLDMDYMDRVLIMSHVDSVADAYGALKFLSRHPAIRKDRIGLMGFSYGGMAVRAAIDRRMYDRLAGGAPPFALHIDFYGPCYTRLNTRKTTGAPYVSIRGTEDASNNPDACAAREKAIGDGGSPVMAERIEGAGHAWEFEHERGLIPAPNPAPCELDLDEQGIWTLGGTTLVTRTGAERRERLEDRREMIGAMMMDCMGEGYIMGRDPESAGIARGLLLQYVEKYLKSR
jgi:dienelactone hydrolase